MQKKITSLLLFFSIISSYSCVSQSPKSGSAINNELQFRRLYALVGSWKMETPKAMLYENWERINDSTLKCKSFRVLGKDSTLLETVDLVLRMNQIKYIPIVTNENNNQPVVFVRINPSDSAYIFENAGHDFPQHVAYNLPKNDMLHAWIEGNTVSGFRKKEFTYQRVK